MEKNDPFEPLWERAISREIAEARGYVPCYGRKHPRHDPDALRAAYAGCDLTPGQKSVRMRQAGDLVDESGNRGFGDGLLMPKYPIPFPWVAPIEPQLRPRYALPRWKKTRHRHDKAFRGRQDLERHLAKEHADYPIAANKMHEHPEEAKYLLGSKAKGDRPHDHTTDPAFHGPKGPEKLRAHLRASHDGMDLLGEHSHRRDVPGQHIADRIDIHPWALERLVAAERVYFVIEGTPKADAVLTRIIATDAAASVVDVPSVTLWRAPELEDFASLLDSASWVVGGSRLVVVVCDADWIDNDQVARQALFCRQFLRDNGIRACVAAPPADKDSAGELIYKGVDDYLAAGGDLDDLVVVEREASFSLALHANKDGTISGSVRGLAAVLGVRKSLERVDEVIQNYVTAGLITPEGDLSTELNEWSGEIDWAGETMPTFTIREDLRYEQRFVRLGDHEPIEVKSRPAELLDDHRAARKAGVFGAPVAATTASTAKRLGLTAHTFRNVPPVNATRKGLMKAQDEQIRFSVEMGVSKDVLARAFGVSPKTIGRRAKTPASSGLLDVSHLPDWIREPMEQRISELEALFAGRSAS